jgi:hypothetical protein
MSHSAISVLLVVFYWVYEVRMKWLAMDECKSNRIRQWTYFNQTLHFLYPFHLFVFVVCICCIGVAQTL